MYEGLSGAPTEEPIQEQQCPGLVDRGSLRQRLTAPVSSLPSTDRIVRHYGIVADHSEIIRELAIGNVESLFLRNRVVTIGGPNTSFSPRRGCL
jgi:hypothetical protein